MSLTSGSVAITSELTGFQTSRRTVKFDQTGQRVDMILRAGRSTETVTVTAAEPNKPGDLTILNPANALNAPNARVKEMNEAPSVNVQNLQRRVAGVLPVRVEVPRAGTSHRFMKPLVIDEEPAVTFRYKRR